MGISPLTSPRLVIVPFVLCSIFVSLYLTYQNPNVRSRLMAIGQGKWPALPGGPGLPAYERIIQLERDLPQHNMSLPYPEGRHGRYVRFSNQRRGLGWNNVLTEVYVHVHLFSGAVCLKTFTLNTVAYYAAILHGEQSARMCSRTIFGNSNTTRFGFH